MDEIPTPKVFISYSWTSEKHVDWVVQLAERMSADGVHVVLDRWDLREGQDKFAFMESMVTDSSVDRVLIVCDAEYSRKANAREGGVGSESSIISPEVYNETQQEKFVPLLTERDGDGEPCVPAYLAGRVYFDFSTPSEEERTYERLLRRLFGRPEYERPPIGQPPHFVTDDAVSVVTTNSRARRLLHAIEREGAEIKGPLADYLDGLVTALEDSRITAEQRDAADQFDELVANQVDAWTPYRNEWHEVVASLLRWGRFRSAQDQIHRFFERCISLLGWPDGVSTWNEMWDDNLAFSVRELFVLLVAELVGAVDGEGLGVVMGRPYFDDSNRESRYQSFSALDAYVGSLDNIRNRRLQLRRVSLATDLLKARADEHGPSFEDIIDAEILLFVRSTLDTFRDDVDAALEGIWRPRPIIYRSRRPEWSLTRRLESTAYFVQMAPALGVTSAGELRKHLDALPENGALMRFEFTALNAQSVLSFVPAERLCALP